MGYDYSYNLLIKEEEQDKVLHYVQQHGIVEKLNSEIRAAIDFQLDHEIEEYFKGTISTEGAPVGRIGYIYIY